MQEVLRLETENDALSAQLAAAQREAAAAAAQRGAPAAGASQQAGDLGASGDLAQREALFEARLQRDQAQAAAARLRRRLEELFGAGAADPSASAPAAAGANPSAAGSGRAAAAAGAAAKGSSGGVGAVSGGGGQKLSGREAELLSTVDNLRAALERAMAGSTPTTRFMQVGVGVGKGWAGLGGK